MISSEEFFLVLRKWRDEETPLRIVVTWGGIGVDFRGTPSDVPAEPGVVTFRHADNETRLDLFIGADFAFLYGEPPEGQEEGTIGALIALRSNGERVSFIALENEPTH